MVELKAGRSFRLEAALKHAARLRTISSMSLEVLVGHCTFASFFLLQRCALSVFSAVYAFIQIHYGKPAPLWSSVKKELRMTAALDGMQAAPDDILRGTTIVHLLKQAEDMQVELSP